MVKKVLYWVSTALLTAIMLFSVYNYFFNYEVISGFFEHFQYPTYLVYPLAVAKLLGLLAIWGNFSELLKNLAYAGFFYNTILAFLAHYITDGSGYLFSLLAFIFVIVSYFTGKEVRP